MMSGPFSLFASRCVRCVVLISTLSAFMLGCSKKPDTTGTAPSTQPAVTVVAATTRSLSTTESFVGEVRGKQDVEIRARVQGYLEGIHFDPGAPVRKGQLLFTIDPKPFEAALAHAKAAYTQAQVEATRAKADAERFTDLAARGLVARKQGDDARAQAEAAAANVQAAHAVVRAKEIDLGYTRITSPLNGIAGLVGPSVGNVVGTAADAPLTVVSDLTSVKVRFSVAEADYLRIFRERASQAAAGKKAQTVVAHLILADGSVYPETGRIVSTDRSIDAKTGSLKIEAEFPNPSQLLKPGQFARIFGKTGSVDDVLVIPQRAVTLVQGVPTVFVVGAGEAIEQKRIEGKEAPGGLFRIESGLNAGERVVVDGQLKIRPGVAVSATEIALDKAIGASAETPAPAAQ